MSVIPAAIAGHSSDLAAMPTRRLAGAYLAEAWYETLRTLRSPGFVVPFLGLPVLLYLLFGVVIFGGSLAGDPRAGLFVFTAFSVFGMVGPGMFGFGMTVAIEREQGLLQLKRALPMPTAAYPLAKLIMAVVFAATVMATMIAAAPLAHLSLSVAQAFSVAAVCVLGCLPFCAVGLFLGTCTTSRSASAIVNVVYQLMLHLSGIFYALPKALRVVAPVWPTYHLQQMVFGALGVPSEGSLIVHATALVGVTGLFTAVSIRRLARRG